MPRRDGFPTNRELQVDFTTASRDLFVSSAERAIESKIELAPAFADKPLSLMYARFTKQYPEESNLDGGVVDEYLNIWPLSIGTVEESFPSDPGSIWRGEGNELFRGLDKSVGEHYRAVAKRIGGLLVTDNLRFNTIPSDGIEADWEAYYNGYRNSRHVNTFKERPAKQSLISAGFFVEEARKYAESDDFDKPAVVKRADFSRGRRATDPAYDMQHVISFAMVPELPLNGYESKVFLETYYGKMKERLDSRERRIAVFKKMIQPQIIVDNEERMAEKYRSALVRVTRILDKLN